MREGTRGKDTGDLEVGLVLDHLGDFDRQSVQSHQTDIDDSDDW